MVKGHRQVRGAGLLRGVLVLAVGLVGALVPAVSVPAGAEEQPANPFAITTTTTAFTTNADPVVGKGFRIVGQVFLMISGLSEPIAFPDRTVIIERRVRATDPWVRVGTAKTGEQTLANGQKHVMFSFNRVADRSASFRARFEGMSGVPGSGSASDDGTLVPALVRVHRHMPIRLVQPRPGRLYMAGSVRPLFSKQRVAVLRKTCLKCAWKPFARPKTDAKGRYRVRLSTPRRGSHYFLARARASKGLAVSYSKQARIRLG